MNPTLRFLLFALPLVAIGYGVGRGCTPQQAPPMPSATDAPAAPAAVWTCAMHPQVRLPQPVPCPICGMDLVRAETASAGASRGPRALQLTPEAVALADIETAPVERRSVAREVHMVGKVALDETRVAYITSWVSGRLDRLFVDYTGVTVRAGDHLVEVYSPTLYSAQQELLQAIATAARLEGSRFDMARGTGDQMIASSREKLRLYGLSEDQIEDIVERGVPNQRNTILAPIGGVVVHKNALEGMYVEEGTRIYTIADLSKVWVLLDAYESDLAWLRYGQDVAFRLEAYPGETFHGRVAFIDPLLDDRTRTVKVRLNVENPERRLKPEMFVSATAKALLTSGGGVVDEDLAGKWICPMHPEVVEDGAAACSECGMDLVPAEELGFVMGSRESESLVIPHTAPLVTGRRAIVYVRLPGLEMPTFEGREILLGPRAGNWYVVSDGLAEGERVVTRGNFKIDSELQIRAQPSMMSVAGDPRARINSSTVFSRTYLDSLGALLDAYLGIQVALAADDEGQDEVHALMEAYERLVGTDSEGASDPVWVGVQAELGRAVSALGAARDLNQRRDLLLPLTTQLMAALSATGYRRAEGQPEVGLFHCPMAADGAGADWLQVEGDILNPYMGTRMLHCGSQVRTLDQED